MTKAEALEALWKGKKITHENFSPSEWVKIGVSYMYQFEDGVRCTPEEFWKDRDEASWDIGWDIFHK